MQMQRDLSMLPIGIWKFGPNIRPKPVALGRGLRPIEALLQEHPEISTEFPGILGTKETRGNSQVDEGGSVMLCGVQRHSSGWSAHLGEYTRT